MDWNNEEIKIPALLGLNFLLSLGTVFLHTCASSVVHHLSAHMISRIRQAPTILQETMVVTSVVIVLSAFHFSEVIMWGSAMLWLGAVDNAADAFYYSLTTYTTLGPTAVDFDQRFRALAGFESLLGPLMIAWSTAVIATVLARLSSLKLAK